MALQVTDFAAYENYKWVEREPQYKRREPSTALTPFLAIDEFCHTVPI
jgi:hypothetical protein